MFPIANHCDLKWTAEADGWFCSSNVLVESCIQFIPHSKHRTAFSDYTGPDLCCSTVFHF